MAHEVPPLPYDYTALEPHIDEQTCDHHDKISGYATNLNARGQDPTAAEAIEDC